MKNNPFRFTSRDFSSHVCNEPLRYPLRSLLRHFQVFVLLQPKRSTTAGRLHKQWICQILPGHPPPSPQKRNDIYPRFTIKTSWNFTIIRGSTSASSGRGLHGLKFFQLTLLHLIPVAGSCVKKPPDFCLVLATQHSKSLSIAETAINSNAKGMKAFQPAESCIYC